MFAIRNDIDDDDDNDIGDSDNNNDVDDDDEKRSIFFRVNETLYLLKILFSIMFHLLHIFRSLYIFILHVLFFLYSLFPHLSRRAFMFHFIHLFALSVQQALLYTNQPTNNRAWKWQSCWKISFPPIFSSRQVHVVFSVKYTLIPIYLAWGQRR